MPSHFSSIGMPFSEIGDLRELIARVAPSSRTIEVRGGRYLEWSSQSGGQLIIQVDGRDQLIGVNPHFMGESQLGAVVTETVERPDDTPLETGFHAWAEPESDDPSTGCYPFVFDCPESATYGRLSLPVVTPLQIAAFAHSVEVWPSVGSYEDSQKSDPPGFASKSFIPSGLFSPGGETAEPPRAEAIFTGHIERAEVRTNEVTGASFHWVLVSSLCAQFDVVIDPELIGEHEPAAGGVLQGEFWLSGKLLDVGGRDPGRGLLSRFGRKRRA